MTPYSKFGPGERSEERIPFHANIPSEEICTSPEKFGTEGVVYASKPLVLGGKSIENFGFRFEKGKVVEVLANEGKEMLESLVTMDKNAGYLGEVALVEYHSPISMSNVVYYTTLIDENASCHLALGRALHSPLPQDDPWTGHPHRRLVGTSDFRLEPRTAERSLYLSRVTLPLKTGGWLGMQNARRRDKGTKAKAPVIGSPALFAVLHFRVVKAVEILFGICCNFLNDAILKRRTKSDGLQRIDEGAAAT